MKTIRTQNLIAAALVCVLTALAGTAFAQSTRWDELSNLPFKQRELPHTRNLGAAV
jgi:hypothetical protein